MLGRRGEKIKFSNVKKDSVIRVYTILGEKVDEFVASDPAHLEADGTVFWQSTKVSSGIYVSVFVSSEGQKTTVKFIYGVK